MEEWTAQIRAATEEANQTHRDAISIVEWERAVKQLKDRLAFARLNL